MQLPCRGCGLVLLLLLTASATGEPPRIDTARGDRMVADYFAQETARLRDATLAEINSLDDWRAQREVYQQQLLEMLGLDPWPQRTEMHAAVTSKVEQTDFVVEQVQFQSRPGLFVTGNLYVPKDAPKGLPAILYVCGHGGVKQDGVSFGNKVHYQHHGAWFARNGYVCLTIDTLQLGEIEGIHHGTYRYNMWWWLNRGYTPAGVEAWNCVRALDYLQSRPEVDPQRLGVTGRSGGGAYSWWIAAIDERIKAAVPVAGITDLENHVVDGCVEGHCDCMYLLNTYQWDYPLVAALVAPRPLLISNTDSDGIFPLDGVVRTFESARRIYRLHDAADKIALNITAGPHKDTQELRVHAFRWFNQHLKDDDSLIDKTAVKYFEPQQLKVFSQLPEVERNTDIHETFVATAKPADVPQDEQDWVQLRDSWRETLLQKSFGGWPAQSGPLEVKQVFSVEQEGVQLRAFDFTSQAPFQLRLYIAQRANLDRPELTVLNVLDETSWTEFLGTMRPAFEKQLASEALPDADLEAFVQLKQMFNKFDWAMAYLAPRGIGPTAWDQSQRKQTQHRRRFYLLGQTLDGMRVLDVRRAVQAVRSLDDYAGAPLWLQSHRAMAGVALYAALLEPEITRLDLYQLPQSHRAGPFFLNVRRFVDLPQTVAMVAERSQVIVYQDGDQGWDYPRQVAERLQWKPRQLQVRQPPQETLTAGLEPIMQYRRLGRTGLKVSEVCLGTMTFGAAGWGISQERSESIVDLALDAGVNLLDTANSYAEGRSEEFLGHLLRGRRDKLILATKVFNPMGPDINDSGTSRWHIMRAVEASLRRLQTDYIDLYQIHHVDRETTTEERLRALDDLVRQGKVRYIGVSNEYAWRLCDALWISETQQLARYDSLQPQYNLLTRDIEEEILPLCREKRLGVIVWGPLAGGYLTGKYQPGAAPPEQTRFGQTDSMMQKFFAHQTDTIVATLRDIAECLDRSMSQVSLRWVLDQGGITSVIVGATSEDQMRDNLGCAGWTLPADLLGKLNEVSTLPPRYPHLMEGNMHQRRAAAVRMSSLESSTPDS